jgi:hypothetical protein
MRIQYQSNTWNGRGDEATRNHYSHCERYSFLPVHHPGVSAYYLVFFVHVQPVTVNGRVIDLVRFSAFVFPWFALILGVMVLVRTFPRTGKVMSELNKAALCLVSSGVFSMLADLFIGITGDYQFQYWGIMAIFVAAVIHVADEWAHFLPLTRAGATFIAILAVALIVIQTTQPSERNALVLPGANVDERTKQQITLP